MKEIERKLLYNVVLSQAISSNGRYLYACSSFNDIATYNIEKIASCIENVSVDDFSDPISIFKCQEKPVSLAFHRDFLIVGSAGSLIQGFKISSNGSFQKKSWKIQLPLGAEQTDSNEVNDLWVDAEKDLIYAACNNSIFSCSLDDGRVVREFKGHSDFIHSVNGHGNNIVSASEDGTVKIWSSNQSEATNTIEPRQNEEIRRNLYGKWVGDAAISKEWLVCGGATKGTLYNLSYLSDHQPMNIFDYPKPIHVTKFLENDSILIAGEGNSMTQYTLKGNATSEIETSGSAIYNCVSYKDSQFKFLSACGASNKIDVTINFIYKDTTLNFYKKENIT